MVEYWPKHADWSQKYKNDCQHSDKSMMDNKLFKHFCDKVVTLDKSIRFIGIADGHGRLLATAERKGLVPLLNMQETEQYAITAATRQYTRVRWQELLGKIFYTCSHYDKLLRVTVPITDEHNHLRYVIIFTFDVDTENFHEITMKRIIPLIRRNKKKLLESQN
jgi:hypothetical protein